MDSPLNRLRAANGKLPAFDLDKEKKRDLLREKVKKAIKEYNKKRKYASMFMLTNDDGIKEEDSA